MIRICQLVCERHHLISAAAYDDAVSKTIDVAQNVIAAVEAAMDQRITSRSCVICQSMVWHIHDWGSTFESIPSACEYLANLFAYRNDLAQITLHSRRN